MTQDRGLKAWWSRSTSVFLAAVLLLACTAPELAAQSLLEGRIIGVTHQPITSGVLTVVDADSFFVQTELRADGSFSVPGVLGSSTYRIVFADSWGVEHVLRSFQLRGNSGRLLTFQAISGTLRLLTTFDMLDVREEADRFSLGVGTVLLYGSRFNGDFDTPPGWAFDLSYQERVRRIPLIGFAAGQQFWEYSLSFATNRYEGIVQRFDPNQPTGDASYLRAGFSTGAVLANSSAKAELGLGVSASYGAIFDGGSVLDTSEEGKFTLVSYGLYLRGGYGVPVRNVDILLFSRLEWAAVAANHEADYWSGNLTALSFGLRFQ